MYQKYDRDNKLIESRQITIDEEIEIETWMNTKRNKELLIAYLKTKPLPDIKIKWEK